MPDLVQMRRDTAANWTSANPVLAAGEPGFETDTGNLKIGDGSTAWSSLPAVNGGGSGGGGTSVYAYSLAAGTGTITTGGIDLVWDTDEVEDASDVSRSGAEITLSNAGTYKVACDVSITQAGGGGRAHYYAELWVDTGSGYAEVLTRSIYARLGTGRNYSTSFVWALDASAGDKIKVRCKIHDGGINASFVGTGCAIVIEKTS